MDGYGRAYDYDPETGDLHEPVEPEPVCTGYADCKVHPNIRKQHPTEPIMIETEGGLRVELDYSGSWEQAKHDWNRFRTSEMGKSMLGEPYEE